MAHYRFTPAVVRTENEGHWEPASFSFVLKDNGVPVKLQPFTFENNLIKIQIGCLPATCFYLEKLMIYVPLIEYVTVQTNDRNSSAALVKLKDVIPTLIKEIKDNYKPLPMVDIETGAAVPHKITAEYCFQDEVSIKKQVERVVTPAQVFFDCKISTNPVKGHCKSGTLIYPWHAHASDKEWPIKSLGLINVPPEIKWSPEDIKEAFQDLAKNLLSQPEDPTVETWKIKEVTRITLE